MERYILKIKDHVIVISWHCLSAMVRGPVEHGLSRTKDSERITHTEIYIYILTIFLKRRKRRRSSQNFNGLPEKSHVGSGPQRTASQN